MKILLRDVPKIEESDDLAYFLGAILGDACISYGKITFTVKDPEFRAKFIEIGKKIVGKEPRSCTKKRDGTIQVCFSCTKFLRRLQSWLEFNATSLGSSLGSRSHNPNPKAFIKIYEFVQKSRENAKAFIEGFYDSEGSCCQYRPILRSGRQSDYYIRMVEIYNTNKELLQFVQMLLLGFFNIESKLRLRHSKGFAQLSPNNGLTKYSKDLWRLRILTQASVKAFTRSIHSSIPRKNLNFENPDNGKKGN